PLQDDEQDEEVDDLDDQRPVEADEAAFVSAFRRPGDTGSLERPSREEQGAGAHDRARPVALTPTHKEALPGLVLLAKVCENYHATRSVSIAGGQATARSRRRRPRTRPGTRPPTAPARSPAEARPTRPGPTPPCIPSTLPWRSTMGPGRNTPGSRRRRKPR